MPQTTDQLKPCPFCGGNPTVDAQFGREWWVECDDCAATTGGMEATKAEAIAAWNRRAVPLVAEAPREPVAWVDPASLRALKRGSVEHISAVAKSDADESDIPLYAALPASLAPMPEEPKSIGEGVFDPAGKILNLTGFVRLTDDLKRQGYRVAPVYADPVSHLRTAPRPTLSDEHRQMLGEIEQEFVALPDLAAWIRRLQDRLREALASASPQQPEQKTDSHLAAPLESTVQGLDTDAGVPASLTPGCDCPGNGEFLLKHHALKCHYRLRSIGVPVVDSETDRADALLRELVVSIEEYEKVECIDVGRVRRKRRDAAFAKARAYTRGMPETDRAAMTSTTAKE
jgi:Lar family restriction alleviation protein